MANYKVWECLVCGWTYNEADGWPEDNIAPGTRWEDVPEDWLCPECGVSKADFEMVVVSNPESIEEAPTSAEGTSTPCTAAAIDPVIIVGSGLAGYNLAREIRKLDQQIPILLLTADDGRFYSKPLLSTGFHRKQTPDQMAIATAEEMARDLNIGVHTFCEVTAIDRASHMVRTDTNTFQYSKLVLATGAACVALPLQGNATERVYSINDLTDYTHFRSAMNGAKRVLVIGAGLIGCEYANDLIQSGYQVEVVDPMATALSNLLPPPASLSLQAALENAGVRFHFGTGVIRVDTASDNEGLTVTLRNGELLQTDIVLSAVGVRPRTELARDAGLAINRGIMVDRKLQTSDSEIYALGDCAEVEGHVLVYVAPLMASARALAKTLTGTPTQVYYGTMPVLIKTTLFPVVAHPPSPALKGGWIIEQNTPEGVRAIFKESSGMVAGFALTGTCVNSKEQLARITQPLMPEDSH